MTTKDRLITFLAYINISQGRFEKGVGLSTGFVNNVGDSIRKSSLDKISSVHTFSFSFIQTYQPHRIATDKQVDVTLRNSDRLQLHDTIPHALNGMRHHRLPQIRRNKTPCRVNTDERSEIFDALPLVLGHFRSFSLKARQVTFASMYFFFVQS